MPAWVRVAVLVATLGLAIYSLLYVRQAGERPREQAAEAARILDWRAELTAARLDAQSARARLGLNAGARRLAETPGRPLDAVEEARAQAPGFAFAAFDAQGVLTAAAGADATAFEAAGGGGPVVRAADGQALLLRQEAGDGRAIVSRLPLPDLNAALAVRGMAVSVAAGGAIVASSREAWLD